MASDDSKNRRGGSQQRAGTIHAHTQVVDVLRGPEISIGSQRGINPPTKDTKFSPAVPQTSVAQRAEFRFNRGDKSTSGSNYRISAAPGPHGSLVPGIDVDNNVPSIEHQGSTTRGCGDRSDCNDSLSAIPHGQNNQSNRNLHATRGFTAKPAAGSPTSDGRYGRHALSVRLSESQDPTARVKCPEGERIGNSGDSEGSNQMPRSCRHSTFRYQAALPPHYRCDAVPVCGRRHVLETRIEQDSRNDPKHLMGSVDETSEVYSTPVESIWEKRPKVEKSNKISPQKKKQMRLARIERGLKHTGTNRRDPWGRPTPKNLPIQNPSVAQADLDFFLAQVTSRQAHECLQEANRLLRTIPKVDATGLPPSSLSEDCMKAMLESGLIEECSSSGATANALVFLTPEKLGTPKARYRFICDTISHNAVHDIEPPPTFTQMAIVLEQIAKRFDAEAKNVSLVLADLQSAFYQVALPTTAQFIFQVHNRCYRMRRLPMGYALSVSIMQNITKALVYETLTQMQADNTVFWDVYIDNILFVASQEQALEFQTRLDALAKSFKITLGENLLYPVDHQLNVTYRGVQLQRNTFSLKQSAIDKFGAVAALLYKGTRWTVHRHQIVAGLAAYAEAVLRQRHPSTFPILFSSLAQDNKCPTHRYACPPAILAEIRKASRWLQEVVPWQELLLPASAGAAITDSSLTGWGAILLNRQGIVGECAGTWQQPTKHSINVLELLAVSRSIKPGFQLDILITDNTSAMAAIRHRYSAKPGMMQALQKLSRLPRYVWYVRSAENEADPLSRGLPSRDHNPHTIVFANPPLTTLPPVRDWCRRQPGCGDSNSQTR